MKGTEGLGVPPTNKNGKEKQKKKTSLTFQYGAIVFAWNITKTKKLLIHL